MTNSTPKKYVAEENIQKTISEESDDGLLRRIKGAEDTIEVCTKNIKSAKAELLSRRKKEIDLLLKAKDEPYGDVNIVVGNHKVKVNVPKKVDWDSDILSKIWDDMQADGVRPQDYIDREYDVSETKFKSWDLDMQSYFMKARTVTPGNLSLKIIEEK